MGGKRKGTSVSAPAVTTSVVSHGTTTQDSWEATMYKLKEMNSNENLFGYVNIGLQKSSECMAALQASQSEVEKKAELIKNNLTHQIEQAREACRAESNDLYQIKENLSRLEYEKNSLKDALAQVEVNKHASVQRIHKYQQEAKQQVESIDQVEAERIKQVPRLKSQISLYAKVTGIKWDYDRQDVIAGEVAVPGKASMRRFSIDPKKHSEFEIVNMLWSLKDGTFPMEG